MNKQKRQGIADAFRACLPYLWDGVYPSAETTPYICKALERSDSAYRRAAQQVIESRLRYFDSLDLWLYYQLGHERHEAEITIERMQDHRKAWVLKLIEEFEQ